MILVHLAYGFEEMYKDMEGSMDPIIRMLIDQYDAKQIAIGQIRKEEVEKILFGIVSGVTYGTSYKKMNYYDIKAITDMSLDDILKIANKYFTQREYEMIKEFIQNRLISRTYKTRDELFNSINYAKNGRYATDEEIEHACRLACADEFIQGFPGKYDTYIEQGGTNVSGGQKQRLCIARALLKKPKILILDDSTSAVDTRTDALIRAGFKSYIPETTKIIIAQRTSSVEDADRIIDAEGNNLYESGRAAYLETL